MFLAVIAVGRFSAKYMTSVTKCRIALAGYAALYAESDLKIQIESDLNDTWPFMSKGSRKSRREASC